LIRSLLDTFRSTFRHVPAHNLISVFEPAERAHELVIATERQCLDGLLVVPDSKEHVKLVEVPDDKRGLKPWSHNIAWCEYFPALGTSNGANAAIMPFQVSVACFLNTFDDHGAALCPDEVEVRRVDHHALLVGKVKSYARADAQVSALRCNLLHFI